MKIRHFAFLSGAAGLSLGLWFAIAVHMYQITETVWHGGTIYARTGLGSVCYNPSIDPFDVHQCSNSQQS